MKRVTWLTEGMVADFETYLPLGTKEGKAAKGSGRAIFTTYSLGVAENQMSGFTTLVVPP